MIICPNCKEEIEEDSRYCDLCGQQLLYCSRCGRVGMGRRCTNCGGLMVSADEFQRKVTSQTAMSSSSVSLGMVSKEMQPSSSSILGQSDLLMRPVAQPMPQQVASSQKGMPALSLYNSSLNIRMMGINGAVIGRRQGPYAQFFQNNMYVSGVHAQLKYMAGKGWCIVDKHSSNGTKLNNHPLQPDVDMSLKNGDILTIANVNLQVSVS